MQVLYSLFFFGHWSSYICYKVSKIELRLKKFIVHAKHQVSKKIESNNNIFQQKTIKSSIAYEIMDTNILFKMA